MPQIEYLPFHPARFIPNLVGGENRLNHLKELLSKAETNPVLINIFIEPEAHGHEGQYNLGGFGKSLIIGESSDFLKINPDEKPKIDLAVRYTTKKDILWQVGKKLGFPDDLTHWVRPENMNEWTKVERAKYIKFYKDIFYNINAQNFPGYDPSYIAEKLFAKVSLSKPSNVPWKTRILFFDSFDYQYLGDDHAPLRKWLRDEIFPFLVKKLGITVFVSGREQLEHKDRKHREEHLVPQVQEFRLRAFNINQCQEYFTRYGERKKNHESDKARLASKIHKAAAAAEAKKAAQDQVKWEKLAHSTKAEIWEGIRNLTNGKPILLDFLADLAYRECIVKGKIPTIEGVINTAKEEGVGSNERERFNMYLINRLNNHSLNKSDVEIHGYSMADAMVLLTIARHGMEAKDFVHTRDRISAGNKVPDEAVKKTQDFFTHIFHEKYLSFVKNVRDEAWSNPQDRRLLHDEVVVLFREYYFGTFDPEHKTRNYHLEHITNLYKAQMQALTRNHDRYPRLLLEYMEYRFDYKGFEQERATINFFLYEFSYYLNRYADLSSRFVQIARNYYRYKERAFSQKNEKLNTDTVHFSQHFNLISKLLLRENHYHLTTRNEGWADKIFSDSTPLLSGYPKELKRSNDNNPLAIIDDIFNSTNVRLVDERDQLGLRARGLSATGEAKIWLSQWDGARHELEVSKALFYRTGDSHGLAWVVHLLGFEAQRGSRFDLAEKYHRDALDASFLFSQRLLEEAIKEKDKTPNDWHHRYRLRYLAELSNRANGNLALRLRYQGRLLDALKTLNANRLLARLSGIREEVRNHSNSVQFSTIVGRESDYQDLIEELTDALVLSDPLLRRRVPNSELVHLIKSIGLESRIYRKKTESYPNLKPRNKEKVKSYKSEIELCSRALALALLPEPSPLWSNDDINPWKALLPLNEIENPLNSKPLSREIADMYYQFGKLVLSTHQYPAGLVDLEFYKKNLIECDPEDDNPFNFFEVARIAFQNAFVAAKESTFLYLQMEAAESLYRLSYLSIAHRSRLTEYRGLYTSGQVVMESEPAEYGVFHDLLSRFYITEADVILEKLLQREHLIPDMFRSALEHLANALWHGCCHNQERYMLILNVFTNRIRGIMYYLHKTGLEEEFSEYFLEDILSNSRIYREDANFHLYLSHFFRALKMEIEMEIAPKKYAKVKIGITGLMEYGKFVKAADVNNCLIRLLRKSLEAKNLHDPTQVSKSASKIKHELALRYFQQIYCYLGANRWRRADDLLKDAAEKFTGDDQFIFDATAPLANHGGYQYKTLEAAILGLAKGISTYRTNEYWNLEAFILGELKDFRKKEKYATQMAEAERYLIGVVHAFRNVIISAADFSENRALMRLASEALFRLGELYILLELKKDQRQKIERWIKWFVAPQIDRLLKIKVKRNFKVEFANSCRYDDSPAILLLNCAYYLALITDDKHRAVDALQSIANARYIRGETRKGNNPHEKGRINIIQNIHSGVQEYTRQKRDDGSEKMNFPIVEAKLWLVEGDIYFSDLFEYRLDKSKNENRFFLRENNFPKSDKRRNSKIKGILHEMMWRYLTSLDLLTEDKNQYDSYHFQNMAFEINRRIMHISDPQFVRYVMEDLRSVWNLFPHLRSKERILKSLEHDLRTHALALSIQNILKEDDPHTSDLPTANL